MRERLADDTAALARRRREEAAETARAAELRAGLADLPALVRQVEDVSVALGQAQREHNELTSRQGALVGRLQHLADLEEEGHRLGAERKRLAEEEGIYRQLAEGFGKRGIQAMIIEGAVPELEDEANAILANMPGSATTRCTPGARRSGSTSRSVSPLLSCSRGGRARSCKCW